MDKIVIKDKILLCSKNYLQKCFGNILEVYRYHMNPAGRILYYHTCWSLFGDENFTQILPIINIDNALIIINYCIINICCEEEDRSLKYYKG